MKKTNLDKGAAPPLARLQFAAGRSGGAAGLVVTFHVRGTGFLGGGLHLGEPGDGHGAPGTGESRMVAGVRLGAAVDPVFATNRLHDRTRGTIGYIKQSVRFGEGAAGGGV